MLRRSGQRSFGASDDGPPYTLGGVLPLPTPPLLTRTASPAVKTALITLGRLPVALEIARALHADGWRVVVAEPLRWHLCRTSRAVARCRIVTAPDVDAERYLDDLLGVVATESVSLVVPVSEEAVFVAGLHGRLPGGVALACPPQALLLELHDKWRFARRGARARTRRSGDGAGVERGGRAAGRARRTRSEAAVVVLGGRRAPSRRRSFARGRRTHR